MDAVEFIKERNRMCKSFYVPEHGDCRDCPAKWKKCSDIDSEDIDPDKIVAIVEEWSAAHPRKTRQSVFLEQWPNAKLEGGFLHINPCKVDSNFSKNVQCSSLQCPECQREFWMQEVE